MRCGGHSFAPPRPCADGQDDLESPVAFVGAANTFHNDTALNDKDGRVSCPLHQFANFRSIHARSISRRVTLSS